MTVVLSDFGLVGFVSGVGPLEACHEGWFCGAGRAGAAAEHFVCIQGLIIWIDCG